MNGYVGTSICGVTAVVATSAAIEAEEEDTALAVGTITLFGLLAVLVYPFLGHLLHMVDSTFGLWVGTSVNDTSQVVATGHIYSETAGKYATVIKLTRNLFMAPVIVLLCLLYFKNDRANPQSKDQASTLDYKKAFPLFVLGFVGMAILRSMNVFTTEGISLMKLWSGYFIVVAIAGVGLGVSFASIRKIGLKPFCAGLFASILMGAVSFSLIALLK